jgi:DNA-directed RNA polymerase subunit K/omega
VGNKFLLVNALSTRAKQVAEGSLPYVDDFDPEHPLGTATKEFSAGKIKVKQSTAVKVAAREAKEKEKEEKAMQSLTLEDLGKKEKKKYKKKKK